MARASRKLAMAHLAQHEAERLLGDNDAEFLEKPLAKFDDPPSARSHEPQGSARSSRTAASAARCAIVQPRRLPWRLAIDQAFPTMRIEPDHPVANDLQSDAANLSRLGAARAV